MKYLCLFATILAACLSLGQSRHLEPLQFSTKQDHKLLQKHLQNNCVPIKSDVALVRQCFDTTVVAHNKTHYLRVPEPTHDEDYLVNKKLAIAMRNKILYHFVEILEESKITDCLKELYEKKP